MTCNLLNCRLWSHNHDVIKIRLFSGNNKKAFTIKDSIIFQFSFKFHSVFKMKCVEILFLGTILLASKAAASSSESSEEQYYTKLNFDFYRIAFESKEVSNLIYSNYIFQYYSFPILI
jgi:hypothetical protein